MDNDGYEDVGDDAVVAAAVAVDDKRIDEMESQQARGNAELYAPKKTFDLDRTASITREEEQITFSWENLTVRTKASAGRSIFRKAQPRSSKILVDNTTGYVRPGELVAIMGASGAGKSTLLNALTFRATGGLEVAGSRYVNGNAVSPNGLTAVSAYIMQDDLFIGTLTPREHLEFMAKVRMDRSIPKHRREERVDAVIAELGLTKCENTLIGIAGRVKGISGGESKRLAFASEVLTNPPLLFCDEPTSGLDSYMAQNVVEVLRALTRQGKSIICTIHQPSSQVFSIFDKVLLMAEGRLAYLGGIDRCFQFFSECGYPCPEMFNPSDHYVHVLAITPGDEDRCRERVQAITNRFKESDEGKSISSFVEYEKAHQKTHPNLLQEERKKPSPYRVGWWAQFWALLWRAWISVLKEPWIIRVNVGQTIIIALMIGIVFFDQDYDQEGVLNINGAIFIMLTNVTFGYQFSVINVFCLELPIFLREHFNGAYRVETYYLTKQLAELPIFLVLPVIFTSIMYWMVGLNPEFERFVICALIILLLTQVVVSWGYFISCVAANVQMALALAPPFMIPILLFGGYFLNSDTIPGWLSWIQYISWFYYANEALTVNQWEDVTDIDCEEEYMSYSLNSTISCNGPASDLPGCSGGADSIDSVDFPIPCQFQTGEDIIDFYAMDVDNMTRDIIMLGVMFVVLRVAGLLVLYARAYRRNK